MSGPPPLPPRPPKPPTGGRPLPPIPPRRPHNTANLKAWHGNTLEPPPEYSPWNRSQPPSETPRAPPPLPPRSLGIPYSLGDGSSSSKSITAPSFNIPNAGDSILSSQTWPHPFTDPQSTTSSHAEIHTQTNRDVAQPGHDGSQIQPPASLLPRERMPQPMMHAGYPPDWPPKPHNTEALQDMTRRTDAITRETIEPRSKTQPQHDVPQDPIPHLPSRNAAVALPLHPVLPPLSFCPGAAGYSLDYEHILWYSITAIPNFDICSKCYAEHIASSPLANSFIQRRYPTGTNTTCDFYTPRVRSLWAEALQTRNIQRLSQYMYDRGMISPCRGMGGVKGPSSTRWFTLKPAFDTIGGGFAVCESCYNDFVVGSLFAAYFSPTASTHAPGPEDVNSCDFASPFIRRAFLDGSNIEDWSNFSEFARLRMDVPPCPGVGGNATKGNMPMRWCVPKAYHVPGMYVCLACHLDYIMPTAHSDDFEPTPMLSEKENHPCALAIPALRFVYSQELTEDSSRTWDIARDAAQACFANPCTIRGIVSDEWYTLAPPFAVQEHDICKACYSAWIIPLGRNISSAFTLRRRLYPGTTPGMVAEHRLCDLFMGSPRLAHYLGKLVVSYAKKDITPFAEYAQERAQFPVCTRDLMVEGGSRRWFGTEEWVACEECWFDVIRPTSLASSLPIQAQHLPTPQLCSLYSVRMRTLFNSAASPSQSYTLADFSAEASARTAIFAHIAPQIESLAASITTKKEQLATLASEYTTLTVDSALRSMTGQYNLLDMINGGTMELAMALVAGQMDEGAEGLRELIRMWREIE